MGVVLQNARAGSCETPKEFNVYLSRPQPKSAVSIAAEMAGLYTLWQ